MTTLDLENAAAAEIRALIRDADDRLAEAADEAREASVSVDEARARRGLVGDTAETRSEFNRAQRRMNDASTTKLDMEAAIRKLHRGLVTATTRDQTKTRVKYAALAAKERQRVSADTAETVAVLSRVAADLEAEELRLEERKRAVAAFVIEAAGDGAGLSVHPARLLSDDHRAFRSAIETLDYLASVRRPN